MGRRYVHECVLCTDRPERMFPRMCKWGVCAPGWGVGCGESVGVGGDPCVAVSVVGAVNTCVGCVGDVGRAEFMVMTAFCADLCFLPALLKHDRVHTSWAGGCQARGLLSVWGPKSLCF